MTNEPVLFVDICNESDPVGDDAGVYDYTRCIEGRVYGSCEHELCGGVCVYLYECKAPHHRP